ncbi:acyltransferase family protein [bacterium]
MTDRERLAEITNIYAFGVVLVVLGHAFPSMHIEGDPSVDISYLMYKLVYSFHMPLFFFVSGFIFTHTRKGEIHYSSFILKKAKRLLIPYFFLNTVVFPLKVLISGHAQRSVGFNFTDYMKIFTNPPQATIMVLWFLPTLFMIFLVAPFLRKALPGRAAFLVTAVLLLINLLNPVKEIKFLYITGVAEYILFFWLGCLFYHYRDRVKGAWPPVSAAVSFLLLLAIFLYRRKDPTFDLVRALCGIWASYHFIVYYTKKGWKLLSPFDGYTYQVFLLQWFPLVFLRVVMYEKLHLNFFLVMILMIFGGLFVPIAMAKIIERYLSHFKLLIGM